ncbi:MAG TPA: trehalose-phosphatase [Anaerolineales bacterium]|nr:trehalose-phosphatase [Anaerolineales bacterium]
MRFKNKEELTKWALQSPHLRLFLDYDGTLADFAPTPNHVEPNPEIITLVERLSRRSATRVTILSGRRLDHTRMLLPVPGIFLAGTYGVELMTPAGEIIQRVELAAIRPTLEVIKLQWSEIISGRKGFFLEDKDWALALHARFAEDEEAEYVLTQARQTTNEDSLAGRFRILGGHKFLEIAPRLASKKETVAYLLSQYPLPEARLLYIGDDDKDEEAFPAVHEHHGVAVKVLQPSQVTSRTEADFLFGSPGETLRWLTGLV